jgi:FAD/FMN-containing dehydrogenase
MEIFVPRSQVVAASHFVTDILKLADQPQHQLTPITVAALKQIGWWEAAQQLRGRFTHHYPICFRRVQPDETMLSVTAGADEDWYAISLISYTNPRDDFQAVAQFLAHTMFQLFQARLHWGKWFPFTSKEVAQLYPRLDEFKQIADRLDPHGVFRNQFVNEPVWAV